MATFNTPLSVIDRNTAQKNQQGYRRTVNQWDLIAMYRTLHLSIVWSGFFPSAHGTFNKIDYILHHKKNLNEFKIIEIIRSIFCSHNGIKLEVVKRKVTRRYLSSWKLNNTLLNNPRVKKRRSQEKLENILKRVKMKIQHIKQRLRQYILWCLL